MHANSCLIAQCDIVSTFLPSFKFLRSITRSRKTQIKCLFILLEFWLQKKTTTTNEQTKKKTETATCNPGLNTDTALRGPYEPEALRRVTGPTRDQPPYSDTPSRLMFPVDCRMVLMIPACCVQQDRFWITRHRRPSRLLDCNHSSGRESETSTKRSAQNPPPSLGIRDCRLRSFRFQSGRFIRSF